MSAPTRSLDDLLSHAGWLNRLARQLVHDRAAAQDAVQEAWLAAGRSPPARDRDVRPWLAEVLRNVVRMRVRAERRRGRWEEEATALDVGRTAPGADVVLERMESHRRLVQAVMRLPEPFQTTVLLRFFEDRSAAEVARLLRVPAGTVRWRLKTAIDRLRADLDETSGGDRRRWALAMAPLARRDGAWGAIGKGILIMAKAKTSAVVVVAVLALGTAWWVGAGQNEPTDRNTRRERAAPGASWSGWGLPPAAPEELGTIAGRVVTGGGAGVPAASVLAVRADGTGDERGLPRVAGEARTDARGNFRIPELRSGRYNVVATAQGHMPGRREGVEIAAGGAAEVELRLSAGGLVLSGRVEDAGGGVIAGAVVSAAITIPMGGARGPLLMRTLTDQQGGYRLHTQAGDHVMRVEATGYAATETFLTLQDSRTRDFRLFPAAGVAGVVLERRTRRPVAGAEVLLLDEERLGGRTVSYDPGTTDVDGRFVFATVSPGRYTVAARKGALVSAGLEVTVGAAHRREGLELLVDPAPTVRGRVLDDEGNAVAGALVKLAAVNISSSHPGLKTHSDGQGRFRIEGVTPGFYRASAFLEPVPAFSFTGPESVQIAGEVDDLVLKLTGVAMVEGEVATTYGKPLTSPRVVVFASMRRPGGRTDFSQIVPVDENGRFRAAVLPSKVAISATDTGLERVREDLGEVKPGKTYRVVLRLGPPGGGRISGRVSFQDGRPAEGVAVRARQERQDADARTDASGRFVLEGLRPGKVRLEAEPDENSFYKMTTGAVMELDLSEGEARHDLALTLPTPGRIAGRVLAPEGTPLAGVVVTASVEQGGRTSYHRSHRVTTGSDGAFEIDGLAPGTKTVWAIHDQFPTAEQKGVAIDSGDVTLRFQRGGELSGVVIDDQSRPVADYRLTVRPKPWKYDGRAIQPHQIHDPAGAFNVRRLVPATYTIEAIAPGGRRAEATATLAEGEMKASLRLIVGDSATLRGRVLAFETGAPVQVLRSLVHNGASSVPLTTNASGAFSVEDVPRGAKITLTLGAPGFVTEHRELDVPVSGPVEPVTIRLLAGNDDEESPRPADAGLKLESAGAAIGVREVRPNSPAARAGIAPGDRLLAVGGRPIAGLGPHTIAERLLAGKPEQEVSLQLQGRDGRSRQVTLSLAVPEQKPR